MSEVKTLTARRMVSEKAWRRIPDLLSETFNDVLQYLKHDEKEIKKKKSEIADSSGFRFRYYSEAFEVFEVEKYEEVKPKLKMLPQDDMHLAFVKSLAVINHAKQMEGVIEKARLDEDKEGLGRWGMKPWAEFTAGQKIIKGKTEEEYEESCKRVIESREESLQEAIVWLKENVELLSESKFYLGSFIEAQGFDESMLTKLASRQRKAKQKERSREGKRAELELSIKCAERIINSAEFLDLVVGPSKAENVHDWLEMHLKHGMKRKAEKLERSNQPVPDWLLEDEVVLHSVRDGKPLKK